MKNYKDETIEKLCTMINYLDECGCMTEDDVKLYREIIENYTAEFKTEETLSRAFELGYTSYKNAYLLRDNEDGEVIVKAYEDTDAEKMMHDISKQICFSDCDDTFTVVGIVYHGREVEYGGWRPGMLMRYYFKVTGDLAWEQSFPQWDH